MDIQNLSEFDIKVEKIKKLEAQGEKAYKAKFNKTHEIHDLENVELGTKVSVAGRMIFKRTFGKLIFARLYAIGDNFDTPLNENIRTSVQISLSLNIVGDVALQKIKDFPQMQKRHIKRCVFFKSINPAHRFISQYYNRRLFDD